MALEKNQNSAMDYNNITNSDSAALLPHLESFEKMLKLPVVEAAWHQSQDVYGRVKGKTIIHYKFSHWNCRKYFFLDSDMIECHRRNNMLIGVLNILRRKNLWPNYTQLPMRKKRETNIHNSVWDNFWIFQLCSVYDNRRALFVQLPFNLHSVRSYTT